MHKLLPQRVEIYSNSELKLNKKENKNMNRIQPLTRHDIHLGPAGPISSLITPSAFSEEEELRPLLLGHEGVMAAGPKQTRGYERINREDLYTQIDVQVNKMRLDGKYNRAKIYISLKRDTDQKFSIFLASSATDCLTEIRRGIKKKIEVVTEMLTVLYNNNPHAMFGRLHYKAPRGVKTENFHRKLLTSAMCSLYQVDNDWYLDLLLLGQPYVIQLEKPTSVKQQQVYNLVGSYKADMEEFDDEDEFDN